VVLDHARKPAEKIRISGGGRCNFTNLHASPQNYLSQNPRFCVSALARYTVRDFISLVEKHKIAYHEKTAGQLFCDGSSQQIINMLLEECRQAGVQIQLNTSIQQVTKPDDKFRVGEYECQSLVVATGGLSIPKMGATNLGYRIAREFGLNIIPTQPALVPFTLVDPPQSLSGLSLPASVRCGRQEFEEGLLFTHRGLSGPAILQISSYWQPGTEIEINLAPAQDAANLLIQAKNANPRQEAATALAALLPKRLAQHVTNGTDTRLGVMPDRELTKLGAAVNQWRLVPNGTEGYRTAEVTSGGVDTAELSSKTMEAKRVPNLYFIGEVVDVTGQLGGFNFQWAWASGFAAGNHS
jgi:predicted Rossmann fold flavoprotein